MINRELQNKILTIAANSYPCSTHPRSIYELVDQNNEGFQKEIAGNLKYLEQHRLIESGAVTISADGFYSFGDVRITHYGLDFLADDGGLSAILNIVTVRFEAETLKAILTNKINESDLSPEDKNSMIDALRELPAESIKHLTTTLLDKGLENIPGLMILIGTYLGSLY